MSENSQEMDESGPSNEVKPRLMEKMNIYEYDIEIRLGRRQIEDAEENFDTGLLEWYTGFRHHKVSNEVYRVYRKLKCFPPSDIKKWSISVKFAERAQNTHKTVSSPEQVFEFTLSDEEPSVEFDYVIDESKCGKIFSKHVVYDIHLSVTKCSGMLNLIGVSTNLMEKFDLSNVVIELSGQKFYFVFETLALNSQFFYEKWMAVKEQEMPENGYSICLDEENVPLVGFVEILKLLLYRHHPINCSNVEDILMAAKLLKFEMVMTWCEDFLLYSHDMDDRIKLNLAYQYDMSELQHDIARHEVRSLIYKRKEPSLKYITAQKFNLPEMKTKFEYENIFNIGDDQNASADRIINALFPWKLKLGFTKNPDTVTYSLEPNFENDQFRKYKQENLQCLNYSIMADITVEFHTYKKTETVTFTSQKTKTSGTVRTRPPVRRIHALKYKVTIKIRHVKGLRYHVNPLFLRDFGKKDPSSTVILCGKDGNVFANLNILALHSDYFKATKAHIDQLAIDDEHFLPCVEFIDLEAKVLEQIVGMVYPNRRSMKWLKSASVNETEEILPIADRLLFPSIMQQIQERHISDNFPFRVRTLQIAIDYNLPKLKDAYLKDFLYASEIHRMAQDAAYAELSEQAQLALHKRMMELPLQDIERSPPSDRYDQDYERRFSDSPPFSPSSPDYSPPDSPDS